jgi:hypothetical protein
MDFDSAVSIGAHEDLAPALEASYGRVAEAAEAFQAEAFFERPGEAWCAAEQLTHLVTSVNAVARGLSMRWLTLWLLFGRSKAGSRTYDEVKAMYHRQLAAGGRASGPYVPQLDPEVEDPGEARRALLERWHRATGRLDRTLTRWSPKALDRYRLPHPLLGKLTLREMLCFTVYHNHHHAHRIEELLPTGKSD